MNELNQEFVRLLRASGWHQARAARELGLTTGTVSRYVSGEITPSTQNLRLFAGIISEPLLLPGEAPPRFKDGARWLETWESDVIHILRRVEPSKRQQVIRAVEQILDALMPPTSYRKTPPPPPTADSIEAETVAALSSSPAVPGAASAPSASAPAPPAAAGPDQPASARRPRPQKGKSP